MKQFLNQNNTQFPPKQQGFQQNNQDKKIILQTQEQIRPTQTFEEIIQNLKNIQKQRLELEEIDNQFKEKRIKQNQQDKEQIFGNETKQKQEKIEKIEKTEKTEKIKKKQIEPDSESSEEQIEIPIKKKIKKIVPLKDDEQFLQFKDEKIQHVDKNHSETYSDLLDVSQELENIQEKDRLNVTDIQNMRTYEITPMKIDKKVEEYVEAKKNSTSYEVEQISSIIQQRESDTKEEPLINLSKPVYKTCNEGVQIDESILDKQYMGCFLGSPGSGKTHLINEWLTNEKLYFKKYNRVLFVTPSKFPGLQVEQSRWNPQFDINWIQQQLSDFNTFVEQQILTQRFTSRFNMLIILDDVVTQIDCRNSQVMALFNNRRHLVKNATVSIIITAQYMFSIPKRIRMVISFYCVFNMVSEQWKELLKAYIIFSSIQEKENVYRVSQMAFKKKFAFIYLRINQQSIYYCLYKKIYPAN